MKYQAILLILSFSLLAGSESKSAPKKKSPAQSTARHTAKPIAKPAPITEVQMSSDDGGRGGFNGGAGVSWTLRSNGTISRSESLSTFDQMEAGDSFIPNTFGSFSPVDFTKLVDYLTHSPLFDPKIPASTGDGPGLNISIVRGGKAKTTRVTSESPTPIATAGWVTYNLVQAITANMDWKNEAGLPVSTGLFGRFEPGDDNTLEFSPPVITVLNQAGKKVGVLAVSGQSAEFRLILPPGTYRLQIPAPADVSKMKGYTWNAPSAVQVEAGRMTTVVVRQQKPSVAP